MIRSNPAASHRLLNMFKLMLDFFGFRIPDSVNVVRSANAKGRLKYLNENEKHYSDIARMIDCMGICGHEEYQWAFVKALITEVYGEGSLSNCADALMDQWIPAVHDREEQENLLHICLYNLK